MNKKKIIDKLLIVSIVVMAVIAMHKLSAVIFCVLGIAHAVQYKTKKRKGKQYVS